ncbi:MAG: Gfo/Idh/MocA family oxidoreductase [bacterium]|nr:Gfo/Idh/MocA family oxidoreductase [bacterium]
MPSHICCVVVGYGSAYNWGHRHAEWVEQTEGLSLHGICDTDAEARKRAAVAFGGRLRIFSHLDQVLEDDAVEMVALVTPHDTHAPLAIKALRAGRHVLTEKVMCLNTAEADAMIRAAMESGKALSVFHNRRWDSDFLTVKKAMDSGMLGDVFLIESCVTNYEKPFGWRAEKRHGGGQLYDWGAHLFDHAVQLIDAKPVTVFAELQTRVWDVDVDTFAKVIVRFDNGCLFEADLGNVHQISKPRWHVFGEKGTLVKRTFDPEEKASVKTSLHDIATTLRIDSVPGDWTVPYKNFSDRVNKGANLIVKPENVRKSIAIIETAFKSAALGQSLPIGSS